MIRRLFANLEELLSVVLVTALCGIVTLQVFCRLVLRMPLSWTEEASIIVFVWMTMIGSSLALKRGEHFAVELLHRRLPPPLRRATGVLVGLILVAFSLLLVYEGVLMGWRNVHVITPAMEISRSIPYSAVAGGGLFMLVRSIEITLRRIRGEQPNNGGAAA
ncbi:MAG TPA: TRAP transporter small permease [Phycisphaerae bacterium]|nr:TRAP transporter small permease [Phycisphaerae bacterium]HOJ74250.1 TRAP transporter small permease [Phycisphaerae bacterium]HOM51329.1 TRAP transporter small permease [Phycisphaerae bacterium]HON65136.1 TRAP transporter small permease [Phycisphaerae bacterium]HOQ86965.1 TRAP transporter small permease [Phycisphaerae bacterium]